MAQQFADRRAPLDGMRAAVTGGTSGLGLALVQELARRGGRVAFVARTHARTRAGVEHVERAYNASSLGPVPLALLGDTGCEDFELALATNVLGPFRLTKALLGALAASAREGRGSVVINLSSDAALPSR